MKKTLAVLTTIFLCVIMVPELGAQQGTSSELSLNFGIMTDDSFDFDPFWWYFGGILDLHLGDYIMISPETNLVTYGFNFKSFFLEPAVLMNVKFGNMFAGAGIAKLFLLGGDEAWGSDFFLKLNLGFSSGTGIRLRFFADMAFDSLFKNMLIGVQLGFVL